MCNESTIGPIVKPVANNFAVVEGFKLLIVRFFFFKRIAWEIFGRARVGRDKIKGTPVRGSEVLYRNRSACSVPGTNSFLQKTPVIILIARHF